MNLSSESSHGVVVEDNTSPPPIRNDNSNPQQGTGGARVSEEVKVVETQATKKTYSRPSLKIPPNKKDERKLFVGGLPPNVTQEDFKAFFEQFGKVMDSAVLVDRNTNRSRGFGFISFDSVDDARKLLSMAGPNEGSVRLEMMGKVIEIKRAEPKDSVSRGSARFPRKFAPDVPTATPVPYAVPMFPDPNAGSVQYPQTGEAHAVPYFTGPYPGAVFPGYMAPMYYYAPPFDGQAYSPDMFPPSAYCQPPPFAYAQQIPASQQPHSSQHEYPPLGDTSVGMNAQDGS